MLRPIFVVALLLLTEASARAEISTVIVQNGFLIRCEDKADLGSRAFRLQVVSSTDSTLTLNLETLVCRTLGETQKLAAMPLSTPHGLLLDNGIYTFEILQPELVVTNSEVTREIQRILINGQISSQQLIIDRTQIFEKTIDLTIMGVGLTKKNDIIEHQGMTNGGHFRLNNLN